MTDGKMLLTIFFRHDQSKNLDQIQAYLRDSKFWEEFPPHGVEVSSWYVMMGIGHVVTLRLAPEQLREVNIASKNAPGQPSEPRSIPRMISPSIGRNL